MATRLPAEIDLSSVEAAVGPAAWAAAHRALAEQVWGRVEWRREELALQGCLQARDGFFETTSYLAPGRLLRFCESFCTCAREMNCEHAATLVLAAAQACGQDITGRASAGWERSLAALLPGGNAGAPGPGQRTPLAVEMSLRDVSGLPHPLMVNARLVQPGKNGSWVAGDLSWGRLDSLRHYGSYEPEQVRLLKELYATCLPRDRNGYYGGYSGSDQRYLDLARCESRHLWALLDEAATAGLALVYPRKLGRLPRCGTAEACLDVTRAAGDQAGDLAIGAVIEVDDVGPVVAVGFVGSAGHGVVYAAAGEIERSRNLADWRFGLARLAGRVPVALRKLVMSGEALHVPGADQDRFRVEYYPRLRRAARVISSDGSFTAPEISEPTLVLAADYGPLHSVEISAEWQYQVGESVLRTPLGAAADGAAADGAEAGYRDAAGERAILDAVGTPLEQFGLGDTAALEGPLTGSPPRARLTGLDTMRFSTELVPLLSGRPGVSVEVSGQPANYREASDSVRVGVSADEIAGERDWFDLRVTVAVAGQQVSFADLFVALSRGDSHLLLASGVYFSLEKPELQALARLIEEARTLADWPGSQLRISRFQADLWSELAGLGLVERQAAAWQRQVEGLLSLSGGGLAKAETESKTELPGTQTELPGTLTARLRPYQLEGFQWLAFLWANRLGGILADDMGLGKTVQSLALICHARLASADAAPPFLIVAPTSVVSNWAAEAARFAPGLRVAVITETLARSGGDLPSIAAGADAVVTTYALLRIDSADYCAVDWSGLILDEAQSVKNHQSRIYQCARRLPAPFKLAITGTPMENNLMELWSLLSITAPGLFPSPARFGEYYARPIERRGQTELLAQLRRRIKPLVKRRTKEQVAADLPAKQEQVLEVELHPRHRKLYQTYLQRERQKVLGLIGDLNAHRFTILRSLTLLRQLSLHPGLVDPGCEDVPCAKIEALMCQLAEVAGGGHRALVFSQFTGFLARVRSRLEEAGVEYCYLDGSTRDRAAVVSAFKAGAAPVFLISLKAGGFGLNLMEADYCFLLDPWWNPATEAQAVDRTHRIGQTRSVVVYRLISRDTIEEKVMALQARKSQLFASVMDSGNVFGGALDADDIRGLLS